MPPCLADGLACGGAVMLPERLAAAAEVAAVSVATVFLVGVGVAERELEGLLVLLPLAVLGLICVGVDVGVGVAGLAGPVVVPAAWAAAGVPSWFTGHFCTGVAGRPVLGAGACAATVVRLRDTFGSRSGKHCIQRTSRKMSGVSKESEAMSSRRDWRKVMGLCSPFQHTWVIRTVSL